MLKKKSKEKRKLPFDEKSVTLKNNMKLVIENPKCLSSDSIRRSLGLISQVRKTTSLQIILHYDLVNTIWCQLLSKVSKKKVDDAEEALGISQFIKTPTSLPSAPVSPGSNFDHFLPGKNRKTMI